MKRILNTIATLLLLAAASCQEWEPVWGNQGTPGEPQAQTLAANTTIADLKALYEGTPYHIEKDIVIGGQVISSDASGNIYRSLFIQDETGGIELKIGNSSLYNDYKTGQWVYVKCQGLTLGNYSGMLQLGMEDPTESYETAYMDVKRLIGAHIFKGAKAAPVTPRVISENELKDALKRSYKSPCFGTLVTLQNLTYANEIFVLIYLDANVDKKESSNRLFLSDQQWGVTTWAMSANKMKEYLNTGKWDAAKIGNSNDQNYGTVADAANKKKLLDGAAAYSVSQYFRMPGGTDVQIRSSGYAKFSDTEIDPEIQKGKKVNVTGILTNYDGAAQFTLIDLDGVQMAAAQ